MFHSLLAAQRCNSASLSTVGRSNHYADTIPAKTVETATSTQTLRGLPVKVAGPLLARLRQSSAEAEYVKYCYTWLRTISAMGCFADEGAAGGKVGGPFPCRQMGSTLGLLKVLTECVMMLLDKLARDLPKLQTQGHGPLGKTPVCCEADVVVYNATSTACGLVRRWQQAIGWLHLGLRDDEDGYNTDGGSSNNNNNHSDSHSNSDINHTNC